MKEAYRYLMEDVNFKYGDAVVIGVSGGPDSMALLHLLIKIKKEIDLTIICAHINHNIRKESEEEENILHRFCLKNDITFESMKIEDYGDDNFHNEARTKRYHFFGKVVKKYSSKYLLTAHHADDLMETILMRISRGSTLRGYSGFSKKLKVDGYNIIRPLITVPKNEIMDYNKKNKVKYSIDKSNEKDVYTRNRYRKHILPFFKKEDKNVHQKFMKFSKTLLDYNEYMDNEVKGIIDEVYPQEVLNIKKFNKLNHLIKQKIIYYILEKIYEDDLMLIYDRHAELILNLIDSKKPNAYIFLPNGVKAVKSYENLAFNFEEITQFTGYEMEIMKYVNLPNGKNIEVVSKSDKIGNDITRFNSAEVKLPLYVRSREIGDKLEIKGLLGRKKVKDIFIDKKIVAEAREIHPIVIDSTGKIVWIPGLKKSKFDKNKTESYDIILRYY